MYVVLYLSEEPKWFCEVSQPEEAMNQRGIVWFRQCRAQDVEGEPLDKLQSWPDFWRMCSLAVTSIHLICTWWDWTCSNAVEAKRSYFRWQGECWSTRGFRSTHLATGDWGRSHCSHCSSLRDLRWFKCTSLVVKNNASDSSSSKHCQAWSVPGRPFAYLYSFHPRSLGATWNDTQEIE